MTEQLLTARQVADLLGFSTETVLRWTRAGDLPAVKTPGGAVRYQPAAIEAKLAEWSTAAGGGANVLTLDAARGEA
jgi:excisionase family DNA binding protein